MRKLLWALMTLAVLGGAAWASDTGTPLRPTKAEIEAMSLFLSNFTELGFYDTTRDGISQDDLIFFGIRHNYVNNFKSRVAPCKVKDCRYGEFVIDGKYVAESVKKYFDLDIDAHGSVQGFDQVYHYDGRFYHFRGADGEVTYYANVGKAFDEGGGRLRLEGTLYDVADESKAPAADFTAVVKKRTEGRKQAYTLLRIATKWH